MGSEHTPPPSQPRPALSDRSSTLEADRVPSDHPALTTPTPPTPERGRSSVRTPTPATELRSEVPIPDDGVFLEYKTRLKSLTSLATFKWDAEHSEGIFVPIPYPLDDEGKPVEPLLLPEFLKTHHWEHPSCFCVIRGSPRKTEFVVSPLRDSTSSGTMCLACPKSQCPYFVNVSKLFDLHKHDVLSVEQTIITQDSSSSDSETPVKHTKKRKRNLRGNRRNAFLHNPSSSIAPLLPDDPETGLALTLSHLFSRFGIPKNQFFKAFRVCDYCQRVVCNETSVASGHTCVIEIVD